MISSSRMELLERFRFHLIAERGLRPSTADVYLRYARRFLAMVDPREASQRDVENYLLRWPRGASALRALFRFLMLVADKFYGKG